MRVLGVLMCAPAGRVRAIRGGLVVLCALGVLAFAPAAQAHPLGNFSVNHLTVVSVSSDRVDVRYVLDLSLIHI